MEKGLEILRTGTLGCSLAICLFAGGAQAGGFKVMHFFGGSDGALPNEVYPLDPNHLYLTTYSGGANGAGTISVVHKDGSVTILHSFGADADDGKFPAGSLAFDRHPDGSLFLLATTSAGGAHTYGVRRQNI